MSLPLQSLADLHQIDAYGDGHASFPYSASHVDFVHPSGLELHINIHPPPPDRSCHVTGDTIYGTVRVLRVATATTTRGSLNDAVMPWIRTLALRFYAESRNVSWALRDTTERDRARQVKREVDGKAKQEDRSQDGGTSESSTSQGSSDKHSKKQEAAQQESVKWNWQHEWARAVFGELSLLSGSSLSTPGALDPEADDITLPFEVRLPTELSQDEWNRLPGATRDHHRDLRPSPSTSRDSPTASVEWVCEAILDLRYASRLDLNTPRATALPTPVASSAASTVSTSSFDLDHLDPFVDNRGFLVTKPSRIVTRVVLPVVAADGKRLGQDLDDSVVHSFASEHKNTLTYLKVIELRTSLLGSSLGHLTIELQTHKPFYLPRTNLRGSFSLFLDFNPVRPKRGRFSLPSPKIGSVGIKNAGLSLECWTWTKAGDGKIRKQVTALRRLEVPLNIPLADCESTPAGRYKVRVPFDLRQSQGAIESQELVPSFKTANVEREYTLTVTAQLTSTDTDYCVAIVPVQITSGLDAVDEHSLVGIAEGDEEEEDDRGEGTSSRVTVASSSRIGSSQYAYAL